MRLNPIFNEGSQQVTFKDVDRVISKMRTDWKVVSICDIVLNHTANETEWLQQHTECTYNCGNCPHLRPSCLLDAALYKLTIDVQQGLWELKGVPTQVSTEDHLNVSKIICVSRTTTTYQYTLTGRCIIDIRCMLYPMFVRTLKHILYLH